MNENSVTNSKLNFFSNVKWKNEYFADASIRYAYEMRTCATFPSYKSELINYFNNRSLWKSDQKNLQVTNNLIAVNEEDPITSHMKKISKEFSNSDNGNKKKTKVKSAFVVPYKKKHHGSIEKSCVQTLTKVDPVKSNDFCDPELLVENSSSPVRPQYQLFKINLDGPSLLAPVRNEFTRSSKSYDFPEEENMKTTNPYQFKPLYNGYESPLKNVQSCTLRAEIIDSPITSYYGNSSFSTKNNLSDDPLCVIPDIKSPKSISICSKSDELQNIEVIELDNNDSIPNFIMISSDSSQDENKCNTDFDSNSVDKSMNMANIDALTEKEQSIQEILNFELSPNSSGNSTVIFDPERLTDLNCNDSQTNLPDNLNVSVMKTSSPERHMDVIVHIKQPKRDIPTLVSLALQKLGKTSTTIQPHGQVSALSQYDDGSKNKLFSSPTSVSCSCPTSKMDLEIVKCKLNKIECNKEKFNFTDDEFTLNLTKENNVEDKFFKGSSNEHCIDQSYMASDIGESKVEQTNFTNDNLVACTDQSVGKNFENLSLPIQNDIDHEAQTSGEVHQINHETSFISKENNDNCCSRNIDINNSTSEQQIENNNDKSSVMSTTERVETENSSDCVPKLTSDTECSQLQCTQQQPVKNPTVNNFMEVIPCCIDAESNKSVVITTPIVDKSINIETESNNADSRISSKEETNPNFSNTLLSSEENKSHIPIGTIPIPYNNGTTQLKKIKSPIEVVHLDSDSCVQSSNDPVVVNDVQVTSTTYLDKLTENSNNPSKFPLPKSSLEESYSTSGEALKPNNKNLIGSGIISKEVKLFDDSMIDSDQKSNENVNKVNYKASLSKKEFLNSNCSNLNKAASFYSSTYRWCDLNKIHTLLDGCTNHTDLPVWLQRYLLIPKDFIEECKVLTEKANLMSDQKCALLQGARSKLDHDITQNTVRMKSKESMEVTKTNSVSANGAIKVVNKRSLGEQSSDKINDLKPNGGNGKQLSCVANLLSKINNKIASISSTSQTHFSQRPIQALKKYQMKINNCTPSNDQNHMLRSKESLNIIDASKTEMISSTVSEMKQEPQIDVGSSVKDNSCSSKVSFCKLQITGILLDQFTKLENFAKPIIETLKCGDNSSIKLKQNYSFDSLYPDDTRLLLIQSVNKNRKVPNERYKLVLLLHGIVKAANLLVHSSLQSAVDSLSNFVHEHISLVRDAYDSLLSCFSSCLENKSLEIIHPKTTYVKEQLLRLQNEKLKSDPKILVIVQREGIAVTKQLQDILGSNCVSILPPTAMCDYQQILKMLETSSVLVLTDNQSDASHELSWLPQFSLVIEWEGKESNPSSNWVNLCSKKDVNIISLLCNAKSRGTSAICVEGLKMKTKSEDVLSSSSSIEKFTFIASESVVNNSELHYILTSIYNIDLVERRIRDLCTTEEQRTWADLIVDEKTCILLQANHLLREDEIVNLLIQHLIRLSLQYELVYIIIYISPRSDEGYSYRGNIIKAFVRLTAACASLKTQDYNVTPIYAHDYHQVGEIIRKVGVVCQTTNKSWDAKDWAKRSWLSASLSSHERFLLNIPCINPIVAQVMLTVLSLRELLTLPEETLMLKLPWIPSKVIKNFHKMIHLKRSSTFLKRELIDSNDEITSPDTLPTYIETSVSFSQPQIKIKNENFVQMSQVNQIFDGNQSNLNRFENTDSSFNRNLCFDPMQYLSQYSSSNTPDPSFQEKQDFSYREEVPMMRTEDIKPTFRYPNPVCSSPKPSQEGFQCMVAPTDPHLKYFQSNSQLNRPVNVVTETRFIPVDDWHQEDLSTMNQHPSSGSFESNETKFQPNVPQQFRFHQNFGPRLPLSNGSSQSSFHKGHYEFKQANSQLISPRRPKLQPKQTDLRTFFPAAKRLHPSDDGLPHNKVFIGVAQPNRDAHLSVPPSPRISFTRNSFGPTAKTLVLQKDKGSQMKLAFGYK